jgi:hypothetical protein
MQTASKVKGCRVVLVHLNVTVPGDDFRSPEQIGEALKGAIDVGSDDESVSGLFAHVALVDEIA